jgi:hypothetical protein
MGVKNVTMYKNEGMYYYIKYKIYDYYWGFFYKIIFLKIFK